MLVVPARQHGDRAGRQRGLVGRGVDAAGEARDDDEARAAQLAASRSASCGPAAEALREPTMATIGRGAARSARPRTASSGGASSMAASGAG